MKNEFVKCKLYLEGIPVPFSSIVITETRGGAPTAQIALPANPYVLTLFARTKVDVFYLMPDTKYYLIFSGEVTGSGFKQIPEAKQVSFSAMGITNNWNYAYKQTVNMSLVDFTKANFLVINTGKGTGDSRRLTPAPNAWNGATPTTTTQQYKGITFADFPGLDMISVLAKILIDLGGEGDIEGAFETFFTDLKQFNPYYSYIHDNLKINDRILGFDNTECLDILQAQQGIDWILNQFKNLPNTAVAYTIIQRWLYFLNYDMVEFASPSKIDGMPKHIIFKPASDFMAPIRCNVVFPDQVTTFTFNKELLNVPTRLACTTRPLILEGQPGDGFGLTLLYVAPDLKYDKDEANIRMELTEEEKIRGIVPKTFQYDTIERALIETGGGVTANQPAANAFATTVSQIQSGNQDYPITALTERIVDYRFFLERYGPRNFSLQTPYSPYRIVGFPMVYIDDKLPAVIGTLQSMHHLISSNGEASTTMTVAYPRVHWTDDFTDEFSIHEDSAPEFPMWFDDTFKAKNIGTEHYAQITGEEDGGITIHADLTAVDDVDDDAELLSNSIKNLRERWQAVPHHLRHQFADNEIKRTLISEEEYWTFLVGGPDIIREEHYIVALDKDIETITQVSGKPFVEERAVRVDRLINYV